jgi:hypothetical protein
MTTKVFVCATSKSSLTYFVNSHFVQIWKACAILFFCPAATAFLHARVNQIPRFAFFRNNHQSYITSSFLCQHIYLLHSRFLYLHTYIYFSLLLCAIFCDFHFFYLLANAPLTCLLTNKMSVVFFLQENCEREFQFEPNKKKKKNFSTYNRFFAIFFLVSLPY